MMNESRCKQNLMKKILILALCLLLLCMTACGGEADTPASTGATAAAPTTQPVPDTTAAPVSRMGESIFLGSYEQDNDPENGKEPIEWVIIGESETGYWVQSKYVLDFKNFHHKKEKGVCWETSDIRAWLNGEFYEESFTNAEKAQILLTTVDNSEDSELFYENEGVFSGCNSTGYHQGNDTQDYIYLLSDYEHRQFVYRIALEKQVWSPRYTYFTSKTPSTPYSYAVGIENLQGDNQLDTNTGLCTCLTRTLTNNEICKANDRSTAKDCIYIFKRNSTRSCCDYWRQPFGIQPVMWVSKDI